MAIALLPITLSATGAAGLLNVWLAFRSGRTRAAAGGGLGHLGDDLLLARSRSHANFAEYTPIVLILIGAIELTEGSSLWLAIVATLFLFGRVAHPLGMENRFPQGRFIGTIIALLVTLGLALYALSLSLPLRTAPAPVAVEAPPARG
ncbi:MULTISPECIES: MAPEG family protein [Sphingomonas]|uniref:MAPEG family protein n=1 Tax=Sphingomonas TaxID=13687 RepID=UPI000832D8DD|nr:MAPEG family protein [Sphingomonas sp. CCH10-B3]